MASLQLLALELSKVFVLYRQPRPAQAEFELLVRTWADVLADVSDAEFIEGMRRTQAVLRFFPVPADVMRQVEESRKRTPAVNREALPENALMNGANSVPTGARRFSPTCATKWTSAGRGGPTRRLMSSLPICGRWGWSNDGLPLCPELHAHGTGPSAARRPLWAQRGLQVCRAEERGSRA